MHHFLCKRTLGRRAIALIAAYTIALAGLLATYSFARAAGVAAPGPIGVICHTDFAGQPSPSGNDADGRACAHNCCIGYLALVAAVPPPSAIVTGAPQSASHVLHPPTIIILAAGTPLTSHRSRAPPPAV